MREKKKDRGIERKRGRGKGDKEREKKKDRAIDRKREGEGKEIMRERKSKE